MSAQGQEAVPLSQVARDAQVVVVRIVSGGGAADHFAQLGIRPGTAMRVLGRGGAGPIAITVGERRLEIGRGMAEKLLVRGGRNPDLSPRM